MKPFFFIFFVVLASCDNFSSKKVSTEQILQEEINAIDWNDVDEYPTFKNCETLSTNQKKKSCFEEYLHTLLLKNLETQKIVVSEDVSDTVVLKIHIDKTGKFSISDIKMDANTMTQIPHLDSILKRSFDSLPEIYPAIKRSQQVATEFSLPIIVNIN